MRTGWAAAVLTAAVTTAAGAAGDPVFTSKEGRFSVAAPGEPRVKTQEVPSAAGKVTLHQWVFSSGATLLLASCADYPAKAAKDPSGLLQRSQASFVSSVRGKLTGARAVKLGSHPGREFELTSASNLEMRVRAYLVGNRMYQLVAGAPAGKLDVTRARAFLNSFRLLK